MPLQVTTINSIPRATRNKKRSLEGTEEWAQLKAKLAEGLRPYEAIYVTFTKQQMETLGIKTAGRIFALMAKQYVRRLNLPYDTWRYHSDGQEVVVIAAREAEKIGASEERVAVAVGAGAGAGGGGGKSPSSSKSHRSAPGKKRH